MSGGSGSEGECQGGRRSEGVRACVRKGVRECDSVSGEGVGVRE